MGATVPMVSKQHGVPTSRIYSWRGYARFQPSEVETPDYMWDTGLEARERTRGTNPMTGAILDRQTHHVHILEKNGESFRLRQSRRTRS